MNSNFTNTIYFIVILFILVCLFFYTKITKETFFNTSSSEMPKGTIVLLDGKTTDGKGFNIYSNQTTNSCRNKCKRTLINNNKTCTFNTQDDGNLVIYNSNGRPVWASNSNKRGRPSYTSYMQQDGNFLTLDGGGRVIWGSYSQGRGIPPYDLVLQDDCNLVIYDKNKSAIWSSGSNGKGSGPMIMPTQQKINWSQISGSLFCVSLAPNGDIWGTDSDGNIFYKTKALIDFSKIPGSLKMIDTDGKYVCGISPNNTAYCAEYKDALKGNWQPIANNVKWISTSDGRAFIISTDNSIKYTYYVSNPNWQSVPITFKRFISLSLDGVVLVGISDSFELLYADSNTFSIVPNFNKIVLNSEIKTPMNVSLQNNTVMLTDIEGNLWYTPSYLYPSWTKINTNGKAFMAAQII